MTSSGMPAPLITTPLTRRMLILDSFQWNSRCSDFELRTLECYESYGFTNKGKCKDYLDDLRECLLGRKRDLRARAMRKERILQDKEGTRKVLYAEAPPVDSY